MRKQRNVVMLPTEKASNLYQSTGPNKTLWFDKEQKVDISKYVPQHLYFTAPSIKEDKVNGEEIKGNEWVIVTVRDDTRIKYLQQIIVIEKNQIYCKGDKKFSREYYNWEKVIATTNFDLHFKAFIGGVPNSSFDKPFVPKIPLDFVERYVKEQGEIEKVDVEYEIDICTCTETSGYGHYEGLKCDRCHKNKSKQGRISHYRPKLNNNGSVKVFPVEESWDDIWSKRKDFEYFGQFWEYVTLNYSTPKKLK